MNTITIKDENGVIKTYAEVPSTPQEVTKEVKANTKYRKNGALVFAPEFYSEFWSIHTDFEITDPCKWSGYDHEIGLLQQNLIFDSEDKAQLWADKLKIAYELKQKIVEAESENEYNTDIVLISYGKQAGKIYVKSLGDAYFQVALVSSVAKDILMSKDVSDKHFQYYIEVFSL